MTGSTSAKTAELTLLTKSIKVDYFAVGDVVSWGENNPNWAGENVTYISLHVWIYDKLPDRGFCVCCKKKKKTDAHNINGKYERNLKDWEWLCRKCHMGKDGRIKGLISRNKSKKVLVDISCLVCNKKFHPDKSITKYCSRKCFYKARRKNNL